MYCYFCTKPDKSVKRRYYKWSNFRLDSCDKCDATYATKGIKICKHCGISDLQYPEITFTKDTGKSYLCYNCLGGFRIHCMHCSERLNYSLEQYVGRYVVCQNCRKMHGYWNAEGEILDDNNTILDTNRKFGIEIEVSRCNNFFDAPRDWSCVHEGTETVQREFTSVPMRGDKGVYSLKNLCNFARKDCWQVNERCGLHVHVDCSDLDEANLVQILAGYVHSYDYWRKLVAPNRTENRFCRSFHKEVYDDLMSKDLAKLPDSVFRQRYYWTSFESLLKHNTIEFRMHEGTINFNKIFYWLNANLRFVDWCLKHTVDEITKHFTDNQFAGFDAVMGRKIMKYYDKKIKGAKPKAMTFSDMDDFANVIAAPLRVAQPIRGIRRVYQAPMPDPLWYSQTIVSTTPEETESVRQLSQIRDLYDVTVRTYDTDPSDRPDVQRSDGDVRP